MATISDMRRIFVKISSFLLPAFLIGCSSFPNTDLLFHEIAIQPSQRVTQDKSFELPFNAYVVGVEKANWQSVGSIYECEDVHRKSHQCLNINAEYFATDKNFQRKMREIYTWQYKHTFVSHIAKYSTNSASKPCFIYNIYDQTSSCKDVLEAIPQKGQFVQESWNALSQLGSEITKDIQTIRPTHFIVYMMGWNTPQWEAIKNYRDLFENLIKAARDNPAEEFRPIFLGMSWPSTGSPTLPGADFGIKAKDADDVGMIWGNILINRVLADLKAKYGIPIIVVGHSFGARASSRAVFSAPLLTPDALPHKNVDLLVGLQGAYSFQRYIKGAGVEGSPYRDYSTMVGKAVLTSSRHDEAVKKAGHGDFFVGSSVSYEKTKNPEYSSYFEHIQTDAQGLTSIPSCNPSKIAYVDASSIINKVQPGTSPANGAHSFIYGIEVGRLVYEFISKCVKPSRLSQNSK